MKVWIAFGRTLDQFEDILGVYATEAKALDRIDAVRKVGENHKVPYYEQFNVFAYEVDKDYA